MLEAYLHDCYETSWQYFEWICLKWFNIFRLSLKIYEDIRRNHIKKKLIDGKLGKRICKKQAGNYTNCNFCGVTQLCSKKVVKVFTLVTLLSLKHVVGSCHCVGPLSLLGLSSAMNVLIPETNFFQHQFIGKVL